MVRTSCVLARSLLCLVTTKLGITFLALLEQQSDLHAQTPDKKFRTPFPHVHREKPPTWIVCCLTPTNSDQRTPVPVLNPSGSSRSIPSPIGSLPRVLIRFIKGCQARMRHRGRITGTGTICFDILIL